MTTNSWWLGSNPTGASHLETLQTWKRRRKRFYYFLEERGISRGLKWLIKLSCKSLKMKRKIVLFFSRGSCYSEGKTSPIIGGGGSQGPHVQVIWRHHKLESVEVIELVRKEEPCSWGGIISIVKTVEFRYTFGLNQQEELNEAIYRPSLQIEDLQYLFEDHLIIERFGLPLFL